eukprot:216787_1
MFQWPWFLNTLVYCNWIVFAIHRDLDIADIPVVDVGAFVYGTNEQKLEIAKQFDTGFHLFGAVRCINYSIPIRLLEDLFSGSDAFYKKDLDYKLQYKYGNTQAAPGYNPFGTEITGNIYEASHNLDLVEGFYIFANWDNLTYLDMQAGNIYNPSFNKLPSEFRTFLPEYWMFMREFTKNIHWIATVALGFGINENIFEQNMTENSLMAVRLSHYFPVPNAQRKYENDIGIRFNAHKDYTGFTFIQKGPNGCADSGLQIYTNNSWFDVGSFFNEMIVVGGEFIERWTNDYWISSLHRVVYDNMTAPTRRMSVITFTSPNVNVDIDILTSAKCMGTDRKYDKINGFELLQQRINTASTSTQQKKEL